MENLSSKNEDVYVEEPHNSLRRTAEEYKAWANGQPKFSNNDSSSENGEPAKETQNQLVKTNVKGSTKNHGQNR